MSEGPDHRGGTRKAFLHGVRTMVPVAFAIMPFAILLGVTAGDAGWSWWMVLAQSAFVLAGAAQLAMVRLLEDGTPVIIVILTAALINLRFAMYGAALRPWLAHVSMKGRALAAYALTDQAFAVGTGAFEDLPKANRYAFHMGAALTLPAAWIPVTTLAAALGSRLPSGWSFEFAVPLTFLALLAPALRPPAGRSATTMRAAWTAALVGGGVATAAWSLPYNLGLMVGALAGVAVGAVVGSRNRPAAEARP